MCGIAGIFSDKGNISYEFLEEMSKTLAHRGPDGCGIKVFDKCGLVHRRLSIIDLSENASQPMTNEDNSLWLVFNGEIYNYIELRDILIKLGHVFHSNTDSEVIIHSYEEWGAGCTEKFNGMWAFVIYDTNKNELFCSRDRFGVKPFYYAFDNSDFYFASEIKALVRHSSIGNKPCNEKIMQYLSSGTLDTDEKTMFEGVLQLRPATSMYVRNGRIEDMKKYWDLTVSSQTISPKGFSDKKAADEFIQKMNESVKLRLRSDVPIGTCLSGGLDSSTITVLINNIIKNESVQSVGQRQNTFSACYNDKRYDESEYIDSIIDYTGVKPHKTYPNATTLLSELENLIYTQDEPFISLSAYAQYCVMKLAGQNVKVILDGQGADEQLAGYLGYQASYIKSLKGHPIRLFLEIIGSTIHHGPFFISAIGQLNRRKKRKNLLKGDVSTVNRYSGKLDEVLTNEITKNNLQALLHYEDRNSMAFSIESRVPFLDYKLVEYIASLPLDQKIRSGVTKYVMRNAISGIVPEKIRMRMDKMGFVTPEEIWMKNELSSFATSVYSSDSFKSRIYWDAEKVLSEYSKFCDSNGEYSPEFWRILCTELWYRIYFDKKQMNLMNQTQPIASA